MLTSRPQLSGAKCRVLMICPQTLLREGLRLLLDQDEDLEIVEMAGSFRSAMQALLQLQPDVVVIAGNFGDAPCDAVIQQLREASSEFPVLIVSDDTDSLHVQQALAGGATGYLPLDVKPDQLLWAVNNVANGELTLHPQIMRALASHLATGEGGEPQPALDELSLREQEVLAHVVQGLSDRDIAQALFISVRTVQAHLAHVYGKLGVHSRTEAAVMAVRAHWFSSPREEVED